MSLLPFIKSKEEKFWHWFKENEENLFYFEKDRDLVFNKLANQLEKVNRDLTFEFGPVSENGKREFVISAGGIRKSFPAVEALCEKAPGFDRWDIVKFRPRRNPINDIGFANKSVKAEDVYYKFFKDEDPNKVGLIIFIKDYKEEEKDIWGQIGFLFLDEALGEYDVETKIGAIVFNGIESEYFENAQPLKELAHKFDEYFNS
ncbi:MAG: hypothetical protein N2645_11375 [Clostridia bacterium]|nr:hypothetical protein [Clostridia bacterium]